MKKKRNAAARKPEILENYYEVVRQEGLEGASIGKIARRMDIHPSLIIHYFKNKRNMTVELVDLLIEKYEAPHFLSLDEIPDPKQRFSRLMDTLFSLDWSRTVDPGVHFAFYYLSFRNADIRQRFRAMFRRFRDYLTDELERFREAGVIRVEDVQTAAETIVLLMEGLEFHAHFLSEGRPFEHYADHAKQLAMRTLDVP